MSSDQSTNDVPGDRCGYTYPEDFDPALYRPGLWTRPNSCFRPSLPDSGRCKIHADPDDTEYKGEFLNAHPVGGVSLDGATLPGEFATQVDWSNASLLRDIDLPEADLEDVDLTHAELEGADLTGAELEGADLTDATLHHANLTRAELVDADLTEADLSPANLTGTNLERADLTGAELVDADLPNANLGGVNLAMMNLNKANLAGAELVGADLTGAGLRDANLTGAELGRADLTGAALIDANLTRAELKKADLTGAELVDADLTRAELEKADLTGANCEDATFNETTLVRASLDTVDLVRADFSEAHLFGTTFDGARIDGGTQFATDGPVADLDTPNHCRYDTDAPLTDPIEAVVEDAEAFEDRDESIEEIRARRARSTYRRLETLASTNGYPDLQSEMFIRRQEARRELLAAEGRTLSALFAGVQRLLFNYGESFRRILGLSLVTILLSWLLYLTTGIVKTDGGTALQPEAVADSPVLLIRALHHSILVFFSGNQVFETTGVIGEFVIIAEAMVGPILVALLIFVLGRRAAR